MHENWRKLVVECTHPDLESKAFQIALKSGW